MKLFEAYGEIVLRGMDKVNAGIKNFERQGAAVAKRLNEIGSKVQEVGGNLTAGLTVPITALGAALAGISIQTVNYIGELEQAGRQIGVTARELQGLHIAFRGAVPADEVTEAFGRLMVGIRQYIADGTGDLQDFFDNVARRYGITARQMQEMAPADAMELFLRTNQRASNGLIQFGARLDQLGPGMRELGRIWREEGPGSFGRRLEGAEDAPDRISENLMRLRDRWVSASRDMGAEITGLRNNVAEAFLPVMIRLTELFESRALPLLERGVEFLSALSERFLALDEGTQAWALGLGGIVAILGPILVVVGAVIKVISPLIALFASLSGAAVRLVAALNPITRVIAVGVLAFKAGEIAMDYFWAAIGRLAAAIAPTIRDWLVSFGEFASGLADWGRSAYEGFVGWIQRLPEAVLGILTRLVDRAVGLARSMAEGITSVLSGLYDVVVGNSIIPDLADDVVNELDGMASKSIAETSRMARGMEEAMPREGLNLDENGMPPGASRSGGVVVDLSHSVFRDDRDLLDRMRTHGADPLGVF